MTWCPKRERSNDETSYIRGRRAGYKGILSVPAEVEFVQDFLSFWSHFVLGVSCPLLSNPDLKR
jgi:hypothetical protein